MPFLFRLCFFWLFRHFRAGGQQNMNSMNDGARYCYIVRSRKKIDAELPASLRSAERCPEARTYARQRWASYHVCVGRVVKFGKIKQQGGSHKLHALERSELDFCWVTARMILREKGCPCPSSLSRAGSRAYIKETESTGAATTLQRRSTIIPNTPPRLSL